jgi:hypothetical protein
MLGIEIIDPFFVSLVGMKLHQKIIAKIDDAIVIGADRIADKLDFLPLITILVP